MKIKTATQKSLGFFSVFTFITNGHILLFWPWCMACAMHQPLKKYLFREKREEIVFKTCLIIKEKGSKGYFTSRRIDLVFVIQA